MTFREWFDAHYRHEDETTTAALQRMSAETGVTYKSLFYILKGARTTARVASQLHVLSGKKLDRWSLVEGPTRREIKSAGGMG